MGGLVDISLSRLTVARSGTATRVNASGLIETVAANTPRIDYDPVTLACRGLLIEEARANYVTRASALDDAVWAKAQVTVAPNAATAPDGTMSADKLIATAASGGHAISTPCATAAGATVASSGHIKAGEMTKARLTAYAVVGGNASGAFADIDLVSGAVAAQGFGGGVVVGSGLEAASGGYSRPWIAWAPAAGASAGSTVQIELRDAAGSSSFAGDGVSGLYVWGVQSEPGRYPTSYIPTAGGAVARDAEYVSMALGEWFSASAGAVAVEFALIGKGDDYPSVVEIDDGSYDNAIFMFLSGGAGFGNHMGVKYAGAYQADFPPPGTYSPTVGQTIRSAMAWAPNDCAFCSGGGAVYTDTSASIPPVTMLRIGHSALGYVAPIHLRRLRYYPRRLSNTELQALTA